MPTFSQKIVLLKVVGWSLTVLAVLLLVVIAISVITALPNVTPGSLNYRNNVDTLIQENLFLVVAIGVIGAASAVVFNLVKRQEDDLDDKLLGYVISNHSTNLATLSTWLNLTQRETADRLAKLASAGKVNGVNIDLANGTITQGTLPVDESSTNQFSPGPMASAPTPMTSPVPSEPDEVIKIKAKLYELEVLRQQGKIGTPAYNKLKEEYETKLAQIDTGTKVY